MSVLMLGEGQEPFGRTFFNVELARLAERAGKPRRVVLFLTDGMTLDLCHIEEMAEHHLIARGYRGEDEGCDLGIHLLPYGVIYRIEITTKSSGDKRLGFEA